MGSYSSPRDFIDAAPLRNEGLGVGGPHILLVVGGGIAAYKACELVRLMRRGGVSVTCVVTQGGQQFVTPMALAALSENKVYTSLFDLKDESEMGHIQLSRAADLVVVCPATADLLAKMAAGIADDLATTLILATDKPVIAVPAMNVRMWQHEATRRNVAWLAEAGVTVLDPDEGPMACGEFGPGRLPEPPVIWRALAEQLGIAHGLPDEPPAGSYAAPTAPPEDQAESYTLDDLASEALEPEEEEHEDEAPQRGSTLGSLLSAIIPRSTRKASIAFEDHYAAPTLPDDPLPQEEGVAYPQEAINASADQTGLDDQDALAGAPDGLSDLGGPLLARKGKASSAPPTDPAAINHTVRTGAGDALPQPVDYAPLSAEVVGDPLAGDLVFDPDPTHRPLLGKHVLVTAGPTWEPLDPVRYLANRSSGRQGFAIAAMAAAAGARVTLVAGPVSLPTPHGVDRIDVESATEMEAAVKKALPADIAIMVAAVADWRPKTVSREKMKKRGSAPPALVLTENPDILTTLAAARERPQLLIGFAAETENVIENAKTKRKRKGADWIVANDVSTDVMGGLRNTVHLVTPDEVESFDEMPKEDVARELIRRAAMAFQDAEDSAYDD